MGFPREAAVASIHSLGTSQATLDHLLRGTSDTIATAKDNKVNY